MTNPSSTEQTIEESIATDTQDNIESLEQQLESFIGAHIDPPGVLAETSYKPPEDPSTHIELSPEMDVDSDADVVRKNLNDLLNKGSSTLNSLISLAKQSDHPRAFEVVATLIKTLSEVNKELLDVHLKKADIKKKMAEGSGGGTPQTGGTTTNNFAFVGTAVDLQRLIAKQPLEAVASVSDDDS